MNIEFIALDISRDWKWLSIVLPLPLTNQTKGFLAMDTDINRPVAAAIFDHWTFTGVCVHWWIDKPMVLRHGFFEEIADYAFNVCERTVMIGLIESTNTKSLKLAKRVGFVEVGRIKDGVKLGSDQVFLEGRIENAGNWLPIAEKEEAA